MQDGQGMNSARSWECRKAGGGELIQVNSDHPFQLSHFLVGNHRKWESRDVRCRKCCKCKPVAKRARASDEYPLFHALITPSSY